MKADRQDTTTLRTLGVEDMRRTSQGVARSLKRVSISFGSIHELISSYTGASDE